MTTEHYDIAQIMWSAATLRLEARQPVHMGRPVEGTYIHVSDAHADDDCPFKHIGDTIPWHSPTQPPSGGEDA